jgi:hypothetical protein
MHMILSFPPGGLRDPAAHRAVERRVLAGIAVGIAIGWPIASEPYGTHRVALSRTEADWPERVEV